MMISYRVERRSKSGLSGRPGVKTTGQYSYALIRTGRLGGQRTIAVYDSENAAGRVAWHLNDAAKQHEL